MSENALRDVTNRVSDDEARPGARSFGADISYITNWQHQYTKCDVCREPILGVVRSKNSRNVHFGCSIGYDMKSLKVCETASEVQANPTSRPNERRPFGIKYVGAVPLLALLDKLGKSKAPLVQLIYTFIYGDYSKEVVFVIMSQVVQGTHSKRNYFTWQSDINAQIRGALIDWVAKVCWKLKLQSDTFCRTVGIIDRYMSKKAVARRDFQLLACGAISLAAKYGETPDDVPSVNNFVHLHAYSSARFIEMECSILCEVDFRVGTPTVLFFLRRLFQLLEHRQFDKRDEILTYHLAELAMLDARCCVQFDPSVLAAAVLLLGEELSGKLCWLGQDVRIFSGHTSDEIIACQNKVRELQQANALSPYQTIRRKLSAPAHTWAPIWVVGAKRSHERSS